MLKVNCQRESNVLFVNQLVVFTLAMMLEIADSCQNSKR